MKRSLRPLLACLALLVSMLVTVGAAPPASGTLTLSALPAQMLAGESATLTVTGLPDPLDTVSPAVSHPHLIRVEWAKNNPGTCIVTALPGAAADVTEVTITLTAAGTDGSTHIGTGTVRVGAAPIRVELSQAEHFLEPPALNAAGDPWHGLAASILPSNYILPDGETLQWSSSDGQVATVTADPVSPLHATITPVAVGRTIITATLPQSGLEATCVVEVSGITLPEELTLKVGKTYDFSTDPEYQIYGNAHGQIAQWSSSGAAIASVSSGTRLVARRAGQTTITLTMGNYTAQCDVTVEEDLADAIIAPNTNAGQELKFSSIASQLSSASQTQLDDPLSYLTGLSVPTDAGVLYYNYVSPDAHNHGVGALEQYYVSATSGQRLLSDVSFVPSPSFSGTAVISYTGVGRGGGSFRGTIRVTVLNTGDVVASTPNNQPLTLVSADFAAVCQNRTGGSLRTVSFSELPDPTRGTLYYNYHNTSGRYAQKVSTGTQYRASGSGSLLSDVTFVPHADFVGTVQIPYRALNSSNAAHNGILTIHVTAAVGSTTVSNIIYYVSRDSISPMGVYDFAEACANAGLDGSFSHIYFDQLPNSAEGSLYYNYTSPSVYGGRVSTANRYYGDGLNTPDLGLVSFVPAPGFLGSVTIPYTGYDSYGTPFRGKLIFHVQEGEHGIRYTTGAGWPLPFQPADFNEACQANTRSPLAHITFQLPNPQQGVLYESYSTDSIYSIPLSGGVGYGLSDLSQITFVPAAGYTGTVVIPFNGKAENGVTFAGTVHIDVIQPKTETVRYTTSSGGWVTFTPDAFNAVSRALTGENVDYIIFTGLPEEKAGMLYQDYRPASGYGLDVFPDERYSRSTGTELIGDLTFAAQKDFLGLATIPFRGVSTGGLPFLGQVEINVTVPTARDVTYATRSLPVTLSAADFQAAVTGILRSDLSYIEIKSLPDSSRGKLLLHYTGPNTGTAVAANSRYYVSGSPSIGSLSFLPRAEFIGTTAIPFLAGDAAGNTVSGTIVVTTASNRGSNPFQDTRSFGWAESSVEFLHHYGIITGSSSTTYSPGLSIKRCDFVLMLCRTFQFSPLNGPSFPDVPYGTYYTSAISTAKALGIVTGDDRGLFHPNATLTRQDAMVMLHRAMRAAQVVTPNVSTQMLPILYRDGNQVAGYAQSAVASMVQMGVIRGDDQGQLNPGSAIRRAEMAVILHRVLTH